MMLTVVPGAADGPCVPPEAAALLRANESLLHLHSEPLDPVLPLSTPLPMRRSKRKSKRVRLLPPPLDPVRERLYAQWRAWLQNHREKVAREQCKHPKERQELVERELRLTRWFVEGAELPPHMLRAPPTLPGVVRPEPKIAEKVEQKLVYTYKGICTCGACYRVRQQKLGVFDQYECRVASCAHQFRDVTAFLTHQIDAHGTTSVCCKRTEEEFYRTQAGRMFAPMTVFILYQYTHAGERPAMWTLEQVELENELLNVKLDAIPNTAGVPKKIVRPSFKVAYQRIKRYGIAELKEQHRLALEHYESSLVFPVGSSSLQDGLSTIRVGRNWLRSIEPENADRSRALQIDKRDSIDDESLSEDESDDDEMVLVDSGGWTSTAKPTGNQAVEKPPLMKKPTYQISDRFRAKKLRRLKRLNEIDADSSPTKKRRGYKRKATELTSIEEPEVVYL